MNNCMYITLRSKRRKMWNILVTVTATQSSPIFGIFCQVRGALSPNTALGTFSIPEEAQNNLRYVTCQERDRSAVTHSQPLDVTSLEFYWLQNDVTPESQTTVNVV